MMLTKITVSVFVVLLWMSFLAVLWAPELGLTALIVKR